jgi:hypothetical protein
MTRCSALTACRQKVYSDANMKWEAEIVVAISEMYPEQMYISMVFFYTMEFDTYSLISFRAYRGSRIT